MNELVWQEFGNYSGMISRIILITFFTTAATLVYGQKFYDSLQIEADRAYDCSFDYYNADSLNQVLFGSRNVRMLIDSSANYQVMFSDSSSWYSGPNYHDPSFLIDSLVEYEENLGEGDWDDWIPPRKTYYHCSRIYKGVELIKNTEINLRDTVFNDFPDVSNNWDNYNGEWTVFSNETYLVFRLITVYIGNSSWGSEKLIYFKKVQ